MGAIVAAVLYAGGAVVLFGVRSWRHRRATGSWGFNGFSRDRGGWAQAAGMIFVAAVLAGVAAPILAVLGLTDVAGPGGSWGVALAAVGLVLAVAGFAVAAFAQQGMGRSWRIGVDPTEQTELVTGGLFAMVRNPIFTAMIAAQAGTVLLAPTWLGLAGVILLVIACQLQVRKVEEPYLARTHGRRYAEYARRVGRFLPGVGRHDAAASASVSGGSR